MTDALRPEEDNPTPPSNNEGSTAAGGRDNSGSPPTQTVDDCSQEQPEASQTHSSQCYTCTIKAVVASMTTMHSHLQNSTDEPSTGDVARKAFGKG
ncbi:hypothetical protein HGRIS_008233 [Hohenbuehelia grisea]|uniref:Uncharacterized protein n=1 Tax=Hohenbuehelia grisea TaxID=104357 RepID=A0ABR3J8T7_9AGAR